MKRLAVFILLVLCSSFLVSAKLVQFNGYHKKLDDPTKLSMNPEIVYSYYDPCMFQTGYGCVQGNRYYQASVSSNKVWIWDISNPEAPRILGNFTTTGSEGVGVSGTFVYVADTNIISSYDCRDVNNVILADSLGVSNSPSGLLRQPTIIGNHIIVSRPYSVDQGTEIIVVDITDPCNMKLALTYADPCLMGASVFTYDDTHIYCDGEDRSGGKGYYLDRVYDLEILRNTWSSPIEIQEKGYWQDSSMNATINNAVYLEVVNKKLFITDNGLNAFHVFDVNDCNNITHISTLTDASRFTGVYGLAISGNYAVVGCSSGDGVCVVDISDVTSMKIVGYIHDANQLDWVDDIVVSGRYAFCTVAYGKRMTVLKLPGIEVPSLQTGNIVADNIDVGRRTTIGGRLTVEQGLSVGDGGIKTDGQISTLGGLVLVDVSDGNLYRIDVNGGSLEVKQQE